ncbi:MAG: ankyrin repeat domain-containing protein [Alphaproteobacteria bacterium]|nr:ankyrin repeat domain-containing protein [Alphaproteobacteria bacterium]
MGLFGPPSAEALTKRLYKAIENRDIGKMRVLLDAGADVNSAQGRNRYYTPLYACAYHGFTEGLDLLLSKGAEIGPPRSSDGHTALMEASRDGSYAIAEKLIAAGANIHDARSDDGKTALHLAAGAGRGDVVKLLLRHGANLETLDSRMNTAADLADKDHARLADYLRGLMAPKPVETKHSDSWHLTASDEIARIEDKPAISYRITEIFNFGAGVYSRIARNLATDHESQSMRMFDEIQGSPLLAQAAEMYDRLGGDPQKRGAAEMLSGKKPAALTYPLSERSR